ncbi:hypothetical protein KW786_02355 [Candidatus Parcubacteria bacterium]|nr:hypothetical protein [Candidatus Parcubacteria bacterium]
MELPLLSKLKNSQDKWIRPLFYLVLALLIAASCCYLLFAFKVYLQNTRISEINSKLALYGSPSEKLSEAKFLDYKKKIDYFNSIIKNHKTSSNAFKFLEEKTLPDIWYSSIGILEVKNEITLTGEAQNMETLSHQVKLFEESKSDIRSVSLLNSKMGDQGRAQFSLTLSVYPKMFTPLAPAQALDLSNANQ